ncbi:phage integrase Arm DNA-binding domain-containing protein [Pectobacterium parvum]|uniref:phage integrase Arm DNA-binding domain-containing protein n=1 Tax=Pectobacterium parvum TaxID=2778550 RepID=UPI0021590060|nr:phage integrase Arm DNA-binding domain-containing protein [Pectobacterium parvum]UVD99350.1 phage integrase Arm DNA-binding domain-containing protein [Pectobacterium parvum]
MAGRPRKHNIKVQNLFCFTDPRTKRIYWQYKHPLTGKRHGLGTNEVDATAIAIEANLRISEQQVKQAFAIRERTLAISGKGITVSGWLEKYKTIQDERLQSGDIKPNTHKQRNKPVSLFNQHAGMKLLTEVGAKDIAEILDDYKANGQSRMAQVVRSVLIDVFKEAQHAGEVPPGYNPALATKQPRKRIQRQRLDLDEWQTIFDVADAQHQYMGNAMLLALVTAQRLGDIASMKFSDIWDDHLHVVQEKTGTRIAIPLSLKSNATGWTLRDVIARCRDYVVSPHLVHFFRSTSQAERGAAVASRTITMRFSAARDKTALVWENGTPPTFHEQRSLAERLYREQGDVDTRMLLGHKSQQQTDSYNDDRGKDWVTIQIKTA